MAQSDTTPPSLVALSFGAASVDVSGGAQYLTVHATITDDLSGFSYGGIGFMSPSGQHTSGYFTMISGTGLIGEYQATVAFPQLAEPGVWIVSVSLWDNAGNSIGLPSAALVGAGFPGTMTVVDSTPDTTPPTLLGVSFSPTTIDTSAGPQTITVSLQVADSQSGNYSIAVYLFRAGAGAMQFPQFWDSDFTLVSGTARNGVWQSTLTMPRYSGGDWVLGEVYLSDAVTNGVYLTSTQLAAMGINLVITDSSIPADTTPPTLTGLSFAPSVINTSTSRQNVTVTLWASDDISGASYGYALFQSPSGNQSVSGNPVYYPPGPIAGTPLAGTWQLSAQWPQYSEQGTWNLIYFVLQDEVGNYLYYGPDQLKAMGFPTTIVVTKPSLTSDGTIGSGGGTVDDNSFGTRASITVPPGMVSSQTTVSIDVFPSPLAVPTPRGFTMPGTYFENLSFSPALAEPVPAPGITIVLPLLTPMTSGVHLSLYHIDPIIGLAPAMNASGNPVIGTVDAGGVSAIFDNVVTFSTVVAYISTGSVLGDVNGDGSVNCTDVSIVKSSFGKHTGEAGYNAAADLNNDGTVNILDLFIVSRQLAAGTVCQ